MIVNDVQVLVLDVPTKNGRIYQTQNIQDCLSSVDSLLVMHGSNGTGTCNLESAIGFASNFNIKDGYLTSDIKFIPMPFTRPAYDMLMAGTAHVRPSVTAIIRDDKVHVQGFNYFFLTIDPA